jgi:hypothetical protein
MTAPKTHIRLNHPRKEHFAVGPCPHCGRLDTWLNGVPLEAFCWGPEDNPHEEWSVVIPDPYNPYSEGYAITAPSLLIPYEDRRPEHLKPNLD